MTLEEIKAKVSGLSQQILTDANTEGQLNDVDVGFLAMAFTYVGAAMLERHGAEFGQCDALHNVRAVCAAMFTEQEVRH